MIGRLLLLLFFVIDGCSTSEFAGEVVNVADGDTLSQLLRNGREQRTRLYGIDCPERGQSFNRVATAFTRELLALGDVSVTEMDVDRYGRVVGIVHIADTVNLNERLLQAGLAWHYKAHDGNPVWAAMELGARASGSGLWADPGAVPPWEWRNRRRNR